MDAVTDFLRSIVERIGSYLPTLVGALIVLLLGLVGASLLRQLVQALLKKCRLNERLSGASAKDVHAEETVAQFVYYILVLYVLLLTLDVLGVHNVLDPLKAMLSAVLSAIPNIIAAVLIGFIGYVLARLISEPAGALASPLDRHAAALGLGEGFSLSKLVRQVVFVVIFVPLLLAAIGKLQMDVISVPAVEMLTALAAAVPRIVAALVILFIAWMVGRFVSGFVRDLLRNVGTDQLPQRLGLGAFLGEGACLSSVVGKVLLYFIMVAALVSAAEKLLLDRIAGLLAQLLAFSGDVLLGLIVLAVGSWLASAVHRTMTNAGIGTGLAALARAAILGLVLAMGLRAMGIADDIVNMAFVLILGAISVAVALSFGLGGREAAGRQLEHWFESMRRKG